MYQDEIVEQIHKEREKYAQSFNYDLNAIFEDLQQKEMKSGHKLSQLPIKRQLKTKSPQNSPEKPASLK